MRDFLHAVAPEIAALLRATAEFLDPTDRFEPDPEADYNFPMPAAKFRIDDRGAAVPLSPSED